MSLTAVTKSLYALKGIEKPDDGCKCYRNPGKYKIYCRTYFHFYGKKRPSDYYLWDVNNKIFYRISLGAYQNINEFIHVLHGAPVSIEPKAVLLLARKIRDEHLKAWSKLRDTAEHDQMRRVLYLTCRGKLEGLETLARETKNMDIAADIKEIIEKL